MKKIVALLLGLLMVFGVCSGKVRLEDGSMLQVSGLNAVLCDIEALW